MSNQSKTQKLRDDILTEGYIKPRDQRFLTERPPNRPLRDRPGAIPIAHVYP